MRPPQWTSIAPPHTSNGNGRKLRTIVGSDVIRLTMPDEQLIRTAFRTLALCRTVLTNHQAGSTLGNGRLCLQMINTTTTGGARAAYVP